MLALIFSFFTGFQSEACSAERIESIANGINFYTSNVYEKIDQAIVSVTSLCDENLYDAGWVVGSKFYPYYQVNVENSSRVIIDRIALMSPEFARGLGLGLIDQLYLYYAASTKAMTAAIRALGSAYPVHAKEFALLLMEKKNEYYQESNYHIQKAIEVLTEAYIGGGNSTSGSSIWAFHSRNQSCDSYVGPWGDYYPCLRYFTTVSDNVGNQLVLTCGQNEQGIQFRVLLSRNVLRQVAGSRINTLAFGSEKRMQSMGSVYFVRKDRALLVSEPLSEELLTRLRSDKTLFVNLRMNSGESGLSIKFKLNGSNKAISQLMNYCN